LATGRNCRELGCDGQIYRIGPDNVCTKCGVVTSRGLRELPTWWKTRELGTRKLEDKELKQILKGRTQKQIRKIDKEIKQSKKYIVCIGYNKPECGNIRYYKTKKPDYCKKCARRKWNDERARKNREKRRQKKRV